jgi:hypothetical protein
MSSERNFDERRVVRNDRTGQAFVTRQIAGETVIVPIAGHVGDLNAIFSLNEVGSRVWQLVERPIAVDKIAEMIAAEYDVTAAQAADDVKEFVESLLAAGLLRVTDDSA